MYLRYKQTKTTPVLQLVHSYRNEEGNPRQKILLSLGKLEIPEDLLKTVESEVKDILSNSKKLIESSNQIKEWAELIVAALHTKGTYKNVSGIAEVPDEVLINPENITVENVRELGPELAANKALEAVGLKKTLEELEFTASQQRDIAISLINRICEPVSEHALPLWLKKTAIEDIFQENFIRIGDDRFHRIADRLLSSKEKIEESLSEKEKSLFNLERSVYLYDLTNTYFEGVMAGNEIALRGHSKEKRTDAPIVSCGLVLDTDGFIVQHRVYSGNTGEVKTLKDAVYDLSKGISGKSMIIMDSGMASKENLDMLRENNFDYITVGKRPSRMVYREMFENLESFRLVSGRETKKPVFIKTIQTDSEKIIACISPEREEKEKAILSKSEERLLSDLDSMKKLIDKGKLADKRKIFRKIGRLEQKHRRSAKYYEISFCDETNSLIWSRKEEVYESQLALTGGYILKTSRSELSDEYIWKLYIMLTKVETAFRTLKSDLGLRPVFHQTKKRCEAHIFMTVLAYHLLHWIETTLKNSGKLMSWRNCRRILQTHSYLTIMIPTKDNGIIRIRKPSAADSTQEEIYKLLGIDCKKLPVKKIITRN